MGKFKKGMPYAIKAADNMKELAVIQTGDRRHVIVKLKAVDGEKILEMIEENYSKKYDNWYMINALSIPLIKYGQEGTYEPLEKFVKTIVEGFAGINDFEIDGNVHYYLYGEMNPETGKQRYEGITTDPGDLQVKSR